MWNRGSLNRPAHPLDKRLASRLHKMFLREHEILGGLLTPAGSLEKHSSVRLMRRYFAIDFNIN